MGEILKGKPVVETFKKEISEKVEQYKAKGVTPTMGIIRVGAREDDLSYEKGVKRNCESVGVKVNVFEIEADITMEKFIENIKEINEDPNIHGILMFRPLPSQLDMEVIKKMIAPEKDIDCMHPENLRKVFEGEEGGFIPCTPEAVIEILKYYDVPLKGADVVIVNRSMVLGKPLSMLFLKENSTVTICHSKTKDIAKLIKAADIVVTGVGRAKFFKENYFSANNIVIDVGINYDNGKICGDVAYEEVVENVKSITPVPGGVGTVTSTILLRHVLAAIDMKEGKTGE